MKYILTIIAVIGAVIIAHSAYAVVVKKMQVMDNVHSVINSNYFYEKMVDPNTNVTCYSFIAPHEGVGISCVKN